MNRVFLSGRLGADPDFRDGGETSRCLISVATKGYKGETDWHRVVCFGKTAVNVSKYLKKGSTVIVEGRLSYSTYERDGVKVKAVSVLAERVEFTSSADIPSKSSTSFEGVSEGGSTSPNSGSNSHHESKKEPFDIGDYLEDIPF